MKFELTTNGDLLIDNNTINETANFRGNKDDLIEYLNHRVEAMTSHIQMIEDECNALYSQMNECEGQCKLTITD